jgi:transposase
MARRAKLTQEMVDQAIALKRDGLSDGDIICALGIHHSTFYRWIGDPKNKLQRALSDGLKKEEAEFKHTLLTTIRSAALARNQYWTAAAWLLERKYPDEYGKAERRSDDCGEGDAPKIVLGVVAKPVQAQIDFSVCEGEAAREGGSAGGGDSPSSAADKGGSALRGEGPSSSPASSSLDGGEGR